MEAIECIKGRRSVREFKDTPVSTEVLNDIIDTARFAPSWKNTQIARYVALTGAKKDELADTCFKAWKLLNALRDADPFVNLRIPPSQPKF